MKSPFILSLPGIFICALLTSAPLLLSGCGSTVQRAAKPEQPAILSPQAQIQQLLEQASISQGDQADRLRLQAAEMLYQQHQPSLARQLLLDLDKDELQADHLGLYSLLLSRLLLDTADIDGALLALNHEALVMQTSLLDLALQLQLSDLRAEALSLRGSHLAAAQERIYIAPLLDNPVQIDRNREAIWESLMYIDKDQLAQYLRSAVAEDYRGWLELAIVAKDNQADLDLQVAQLDDWITRWPQHPAALHLPGGMALLKEIAANQPRQIALLLPLSGPVGVVGNAVQNGFLAAWHDARRRSDNKNTEPTLRVYDTQSSGDFMQLYEKAVNDGAELIVGPLTKERVRLLFDQVRLPVPTLALNQITDYGVPPEQLYQFGLAASEESQQVARMAALEKHKNAIILNSDNAWAYKAAETFASQWQQLEGQVLSNAVLTEQKDYSNIIKQQFAIDESEQRRRDLARLIGQSLEFEARRRQDIDMIFLLATPDEARSVNPMLAFHFAADLPVYGTSQLYSGTDTPAQNKDLNRVKFTDMPWVLDEKNTLRDQIKANKLFVPAYLRLHALGVDLYRLYPRLKQLEQIPQSRVYGETGTIRLNKHRVIERQLMWAQIRKGRARILPMIAANSALQDETPNEKPATFSLEKSRAHPGLQPEG